GLVSGSFGWEWVFWINVPVIIASLCLVSRFSKESKNRIDLPLVDYKGMFYLAITLSSFVLVVTEFRLLPQEISGLLILLALVGFYLLWKHERKFSSPIILKELASNQIFIAGSFASGCLIFYIWSNFFLLPLYFQDIRGLTALMSGLLMLGVTLPVVVLSPLIGMYYRSESAWFMIMFGFILLIASSYLQMFFTDESSLLLMILSTTLFGVGYSFICSPSATVAISTVSVEKAGIASGSFVTIQELGGTFGLAIIISYVRYFPDLITGFQQGMQALLYVGVLGVFSALFLIRSTSVVRYK
ncbi:MFS transporter, partial [Chlamydiales bacterium]|nr:MFS transporter [Chlamydiales bacterium]